MQPVTPTYTSWRRDRLFTMAERNGTFAPTFIEKLQQASSDDRILHKLRQYALHPAHQQLISVVASMWLLEWKKKMESRLNS